MKIILTREEEDIEKDKKLFKKEGFTVIGLPLIKATSLDFKLPSSDYDYIVFQSKRAIKYFLEKEQIVDKAKIVVVGKKTAEELKKYGYKADLIPDEENVKGLIRLFKKLRKGKVLIPRSKIGKNELIEFLRRENFTPFPIDVYTVEPVLYDENFLFEKLKGDFIVFYSPSAVKAFFANLQKHRIGKEKLKLKYIAIGKTTKESLYHFNVKEVLIPQKPSTEYIIKLLKSMA
ncbi:MAG TPA: uroporphyrinogen-III synthase [Aquifex aeolicus]|nr:uroporphyrinogen-III synthase [Aquifex aeolicus]